MGSWEVTIEGSTPGHVSPLMNRKGQVGWRLGSWGLWVGGRVDGVGVDVESGPHIREMTLIPPHSTLLVRRKVWVDVRGKEVGRCKWFGFLIRIPKGFDDLGDSGRVRRGEGSVFHFLVRDLFAFLSLSLSLIQSFSRFWPLWVHYSLTLLSVHIERENPRWS